LQEPLRYGRDLVEVTSEGTLRRWQCRSKPTRATSIRRRHGAWWKNVEGN
jgi:hypothetical protein